MIVATVLCDPPPELGRQRRSAAWLRTQIERELPDASPFAMAIALLWHDHWDASHDIVQEHEGEPIYDAVHAILHRREHDAGNSLYWWRSVEGHPLLRLVAHEAQRLGLTQNTAWTPRHFVEAVGAALADPHETARTRQLIALQAFELRSLMGFAP